MKSFDSRVYSVGDYREWNDSGQLVLSPRFQRRDVWTETARSYLMDTIIRGLPIPKVFIRQIIDSSSGKSIREVVDGQQRLRTIISYLNDGFVIRRGHNREYGGLFFSQLPEDKKLELLGYEISTDLLVNLTDSQILDIFSRLNSHAVVLNEQEKINASHFSDFKKLADSMAHQYYEYWIKNKILRDAQVMRMADVSLSADLLIAMCDGIQGKKQIRSYYTQFEKDFPHDSDELADQFHQTVNMISRVFPDGVQNSEFRRIHIYYSLFTAVFHELYGLQGPALARGELLSANLDQVRSRLEHVDEVFSDPDSPELTPSDRQFLNDSRRATTDAAVRQRRTEYLLRLIQGS